MTPAQIAHLTALAQQASQGRWTACRMTHEERGDDLTPDEIGEYTANSVIKSQGESGSSSFLFVSVNKADGPADVCLVGNGPTSPANAAYIAAVSPDVLLSLLEERARLVSENDALRLRLDELFTLSQESQP